VLTRADEHYGAVWPHNVDLLCFVVLQMSIIFNLTAKIGSAIVLSIATLVGFLPQAFLGPFAGVFALLWIGALYMFFICPSAPYIR